MGIFKNRIAVPLIDAFGDVVMSSNIGKQLYSHIDNRVNSSTKHISNTLADQLQDLSGSLGRRVTDAGDELGTTVGASVLTSGILGGAGALAGGGLSGLVSSVLDPVVTNALYADKDINFGNLPAEMQEKLKLLVKRNGV